MRGASDAARFAGAFAHLRVGAETWLVAQRGATFAAPARRSLIEWLIARLVACAHTALDADRRAVGESPEAFAAAIDGGDAWRRWSTGYPVVARLCVDALAAWRRRTAAVAQHVERDHRELGVPAVVDAVATFGEQLEARRTTLALELGGARWIYREKDLSMAAWFVELCATLNPRLSLPLHVRRVRVHDGCSWDEHVAAAPCRTAGEVARYFARAGMVVRLLERLGAADFHGQNVLAAGEFPVLVDIETLFHPEPATTPAGRRLLRSPLRSGLLALWIEGAPGRAAAFAGGLNPGGRRESPVRALRLAPLDAPTGGLIDSFEVDDLPCTLPAPLADHVDTLIAGYDEMDQVLGRAPELLDRLGHAAALPVRDVRRAGLAYARLLVASLEPALLRADGVRDAWLADQGLRAVERAAVRELVYPRPATTAAGHRSLAPEAPVESTTRTWRHELIVAAAALAGGRALPCRTPLPPSPIAAAVAIGDAILEESEPGPQWIGVVARPWSGVRAIEVLGGDLLSGHAGLGLVLAQLHAVTRMSRFRDAALAALASVPAPTPFVGGHCGLGGAIYALARSAELLGAPALALRAARYVEMVPRAPLASGPWDVALGVAGFVLGALAVGPAPRAALDALRTAWERGLEPPPIVGVQRWLPDVATGVAYTLVRAGERVAIPPGGSVVWRLGIDPAATPVLAGDDPLEDLELALAAREVDPTFGPVARACASAVLAGGGASRFELSAVTGAAAIAHALLRLEAPQIVRSLRRLE